MRAIRTIPVILQLVKEMEVLCPDALLLNYVNPMAMLCWAIHDHLKYRPSVYAIVFSTQLHNFRSDLEIPESDLDYVAARINHMSFFLKLEVAEQGNIDLYPQLRERAKGQIPLRKSFKYCRLVRCSAI
ncbi:MAG: hypothetical protein CM15mP49_32810 [Actinomycetota bacterium]|nr:MAG: hypothetical protein CM15mP49_32810 [Actinomycetota bacterium]